MAIRSPFVFNFFERTLRFKGFADPVHIDSIPTVDRAEPDWDKVRFIEGVDAIKIPSYYSAIDDAMESLWA
jgi:hypothetical protein